MIDGAKKASAAWHLSIISLGFFLSAGKVSWKSRSSQSCGTRESSRANARVPGTEVKFMSGEGQTFPGMKKFPDGKKLPVCPGKVYN